MTSLHSRIPNGTIADAGTLKQNTCEKCGGPLQYRQIIVGGRVQWIWQCKICRFHHPATD